MATINGCRYADLADPLHVVGAALESSLAYPGRSARNHLRIAALAGGAAPRRADEVLGLVDLTEAADRRVGQFSLGMRQRLALATALLCDPEILILDEPANGLDPEGVRWLRTLLRRPGRRGADRARLQPHPRRGGPDRRQRRDLGPGPARHRVQPRRSHPRQDPRRAGPDPPGQRPGRAPGRPGGQGHRRRRPTGSRSPAPPASRSAPSPPSMPSPSSRPPPKPPTSKTSSSASPQTPHEPR